MGGSYKQCDRCGKRALSIATRCPGCGHEFTGSEALPKSPAPGPSRVPGPGLLAAALALTAALAVGRPGGGSPLPEEQSAFAAAEPAVDPPQVASSLAATTSPEPAGATAAGASRLLVARDWTNVRKSRSVRAPLEAMLMPGDTVVADSLERDWYRVALYGEVLGYAHRTTLAAPQDQR